jgi:hypothetical protein
MGQIRKKNVLCTCAQIFMSSLTTALSRCAEDLSLLGADGNLIVHRNHHINPHYLAYHPEHLAVTLED